MKMLTVMMSIALNGILFSGCEDQSAGDREAPTFTVETRHYLFPTPNFESQSSSVEFLLRNRGESPLRILDVIYQEMDDDPEIKLLDEDDWRSGSIFIPPESSRRVRFNWNVLDLIPDYVTVDFQTNIGVQRVTLETPEIQAQIKVTAPPESRALRSGAEIALNEVTVGGAARAQVRIQSIGLVSVDVNSVCLLNSEGQCASGDRVGSFQLCDGSSETLSGCEFLPEVGTLLTGATETISVFYAPRAPRVEPERVNLLIRNNSIESPDFALSFVGQPCVRDELTPICGGCGDGIISGAEECDDGNLLSDDACLNGCVKATCGDGFIQIGVEGCDDGDGEDDDACTTRCEIATCGDGIQRLDLTPEEEGFEECDDGNLLTDDACLNECVKASCGDGFVHIGSEECDDGNTDEEDACTNGCHIATCGDGIQRVELRPENEGYEACDDGNTNDEDACTNRCELAVCGDGIQREDLMPGEENYESCDDGNEDEEDECTSLCMPPIAFPGCTSVCQNWNQTLAQIEATVDWNGSLAMCESGQLNMSTAQSVERLLNLYRSLIHESPILLNQAQMPALQECALMMEANEQLDAEPPAQWACYSDAGAMSARDSLLASNHAIDSVLTHLIDTAHPLTLENRLHLLSPRLEEIGVGSTEQYSCLSPIESDRELRFTDWSAFPRACFPLSALSDAEGNRLDDVGWSVILPPDTAINGEAEVSVTRHTIDSIGDPNGPQREPLEVEISYIEPEGTSAVLVMKPQGWRTEEGYIYEVVIQQMTLTMQSRISYNLIPIRCGRQLTMR